MLLTGKKYVLVKRAEEIKKVGSIHVPEANVRAEWHGEVMFPARVDVIGDDGPERVTLNPGAVVWFERCRAEYKHPEHGMIAVVWADDVWGVESNADALPQEGEVESG